MSYLPGEGANVALDHLLCSRDQILMELQNLIKVAKSRMKQQADKHHSEKSFTPGDLVYLKLYRFRQTYLTTPKHTKLSARYYGIQVVVEIKVLCVFHVSLKEKSKSRYVVESSLPEASSLNGIVHPKLIGILGYKSKHFSEGRIQRQYL